MNQWKGWVTAFILLNPFGIARSEEPGEDPQKEKPYRIEITNVHISTQTTAKGPLTEKQKRDRIHTLRKEAMMLFDRKQYWFALDEFNEILALDKTDADAIKYAALCQSLDAKECYERGLLAMKQGDYTNAEESIGRALRKDPTNVEFQAAYSKVVSASAEKEVKILTELCGLSAQQQAQVRTIIINGYKSNFDGNLKTIQIIPEFNAQDEIKALLSPEQKVKYAERWKFLELKEGKIPTNPPKSKKPTRDSR